MIGKIWGQRGLVPLIIFELIFDLSLYTFCLLWRPTPSSAWLVYPLFGLLGIYNSTAGMINTSKQLQKSISKKLSKKSNLKQTLLGRKKFTARIHLDEISSFFSCFCFITAWVRNFFSHYTKIKKCIKLFDSLIPSINWYQSAQN